MAVLDLDFVDELPEPTRRTRDRDGRVIVRASGRPALVTETGDRYVAPDNHRPHGTHAKYAIEKCRCAPCTIASREYNRWQRTQTDALLVDATPAREHIRAIMHAGYGYQLQAAITGVPEQTYQHILYGGWRTTNGQRRKRPPAKRIRPDTAAKILAFRPDDGTSLRVAAGSAKRVPALPLTRRWHKLLDAGCGPPRRAAPPASTGKRSTGSRTAAPPTPARTSPAPSRASSSCPSPTARRGGPGERPRPLPR
jgi:hypothetical protein